MHLEKLSEDDGGVSEDGSTEIKIAFVNPYSTQEFNEDIQFVMEVGHVAEQAEDAPPPPASFVEGGTVGCEHDKRVAARYTDRQGQVVLRIEDSTVPLKVWAGWATGQNPVRLTPDLIIMPKMKETEEGDTQDASADATVSQKASDGDENEPPAKGDTAAKPLKQMIPNLQKDVPEVLDNLKDERPGHHNTKQKIAHTVKHRTENEPKARNIAESIKKKQLELDLMADAKHKRRIEHDKEDSEPNDDDRAVSAAELKRRRHESDARMKAHRSKLEAQMRKNFGDASDDLDMTWHLIGCGFFVICIGSFLLLFGKRRDKGRRDL
ncbi:MAG: hypothetical protein SGILL_000625 [Bacillariaceae sp.]